MLRQHLDMAAVLCRNGVVRPLALLRDSSSCTDTMGKLFSAVLARAEGARPPLDTEGWRAVFRDLQLLQSLLPCVGMEGVVYSYCESLLTSGRPANISLAGTVLEGMMAPEEQVHLVVTAWRHFYSTAGGLADPALELARQVLGLLQPTPRALDSCYDLLAALQSMEDFGLAQVLPLTILETRDRMVFVRRAVEGRTSAYKNSQRLMKLASLLGVAEGGMEGEVWAVIAERALQLGDYTSSLAACNNMVKLGFSRGWEVCYALAARGEFHQLDRCRQLLAFAVCHCDGARIEAVMATLVMVEHKLLAQRLAVRVEGREEEVFEDSVEEVGGREGRDATPVDQLLSIPSLTKQFLQANPVSGVMWQQTSSWVAQLSSTSLSTSLQEDEMIHKEFLDIRMPAFYLGPGDTAGESGLDSAYDRFGRPLAQEDISTASYQVLRVAGLASTLAVLLGEQQEGGELEGGELEGVSGELVEQLLPLLASQDLQLGLLLAQSLSQPEQAVAALQGLPSSLPGLCFCLTHWSLVVVGEELQGLGRGQGELLDMAPRQIVARALERRRDDQAPSALASLAYSQMGSLLEQATDHHQGNILSGLSGDVDVARFASDPEYKEDTILGLAMYTEEEKWTFTLALARR